MGVLAISIVLIAIHIHKMRSAEHFYNTTNGGESLLTDTWGPVSDSPMYAELKANNPDINFQNGKNPFRGNVQL